MGADRGPPRADGPRGRRADPRDRAARRRPGARPAPGVGRRAGARCRRRPRRRARVRDGRRAPRRRPRAGAGPRGGARARPRRRARRPRRLTDRRRSAPEAPAGCRLAVAGSVVASRKPIRRRSQSISSRYGLPSRPSLEPDEVAGIHAGDLADRPAEVAAEVQDAAGRTTRRAARRARPVALDRPVIRLIGGGCRWASCGLARRRRVVVLRPSARLGRTGRVDLVELDVVLGSPRGVADAVEGGVDPHHPLGRRLAGDVRVVPARQPAIGGRRSRRRRTLGSTPRTAYGVVASSWHPDSCRRRLGRCDYWAAHPPPDATVANGIGHSVALPHRRLTIRW